MRCYLPMAVYNLLADGGTQAALCPPFQCRQDEASLTLLLPVPGIRPQSLSGDVGTHHYSLRFSSATGTYALFLQFSPANRLASPETSVSVSAHNAAIGLAKAPGSSGPWEKFCFGLDASALQERLFVSEENVDGLRQEPDLESAVAVGETAVAADSEKQAGRLPGGQASGEGDGAAGPAGSAQGSRRSSDSRPVSPVLQEVNAQDGSVEIVRDHVTRCPVVFQNSLLYELD
ncbi:PREDICTED: protein kintoun [Nipponia nippon]|uniref:protein kintoun n=1 Tax=Nipponia nippon TaxID=128390 RepID=UPI000510DC81|nr:PREDICTED: protein kintoun [Nipponia nippon]